MVRSGFPANAFVFGAGAQADASGVASGAVAMPTGFLAGPGVTLCVVATTARGPVEVFARLHGFVAPRLRANPAAP